MLSRHHGKGWAALGGMLLLPAAVAPATGPRRPPAPPAARPVILQVVERDIVVRGRTARVYRIEQPDGTWGYRGHKGGRFRVVLVNHTRVPTSVHWHGLLLPNAQDGVPDVTQAPIPPGGRHAYDFPLVQSGTYWMHSHYDLQIQRLLSAPLILTDPADAERGGPDVVMFLTDFSFRDPAHLWRGLRRKLQASAAMPGVGAMDMSSGKPDLNDVAYDALLTNSRDLSHPDVTRVAPGRTVRLRIIDAAAGTNFWVSLGALRGEAIAADGEPIAPLPGSRFSLVMGQRLDVRLRLPPGERAYPILARGEGTRLQTGLILATPHAALPRLSDRASTVAPAIGMDQEQKLRALSPLPRRAVDRGLTVTLGGDMRSYVWTLNGQAWPDVTPLRVRRGERVELVMVNRTMMAHPMHLHGHVFQVTEVNGRPLSGARRDTVLVPPRGTVKVQFDADAPGVWMLHCHVLYHERGGMMTTLDYEGVPPPRFRTAAAPKTAPVGGTGGNTR